MASPLRRIDGQLDCVENDLKKPETCNLLPTLKEALLQTLLQTLDLCFAQLSMPHGEGGDLLRLQPATGPSKWLPGTVKGTSPMRARLYSEL